MKPAPSVIAFTSISGLGYGMLFVLAIGGLIGVIPIERWLGAVGLVLAIGSITAGLLASTFHLGHPERARLAISQWRSSWLSREGLLALVTYIPAIIFAAGWVIFVDLSGVFGLMAFAAAAGAIGTVYCTGMIYASLPPIKAWHQPFTTPVYLAFALMTGLLAVHFLLASFGVRLLLFGVMTLAAIAGAFALKILYWKNVKLNQAHGPSPESATGLGTFGLVRMLDPPHTQSNYLLNEMGFQIGRKHARLLRMLVFLFGMFLPMILTLVALTLESWAVVALTLFAFLFGFVGVLIERWLFFAEAEHTVMLYYGANHGVSSQQPASGISQQTWTSPSSNQLRRRRRTLLPQRQANTKTSETKHPDQAMES